MASRTIKAPKLRQDRTMAQVPSVGSTRLASARSASLPPDGLLCNYSLHLCHGQRLPNYDYCIRHIMEDKTAPYKQCCYQLDLFPSVKCPRAAPRSARGEGYCGEHSRAVVAARSKLGRKRGSDPATVLLDSLSHYKRPKSAPPEVEAGPSAAPPPAVPEAVTSDSPPQLTVRPPATPATPAPPLDPFKMNLSELTSLGHKVLQYQSEEEDDQDVRIDSTWPGDGDSDAESINSDGEDPLKHAGVYTGEEVMRTMRDKLIRLQKLYIEQFHRLQYHMKEHRRTYLHQIKEEKEAGIMSISNQPKEAPGELNKFNQLRALAHYHAPAGREALLAYKLREKRAAASGGGYRPPQLPGCQHNLTSTTKCGESAVPMAKFCLKHIMDEPSQVLFRPCGAVTNADGPCETPVAGLFPHSTCVYHTPILPLSKQEPVKVEKPEPGNEEGKVKVENIVEDYKGINAADVKQEDVKTE